jgi:AraC-like DNA-binding protein
MPARAELHAPPRPAGQAPRRSQVFVLLGGFIFSCEGMVAPPTERHTATLLFATSEQDIEIVVDGHPQAIGAAVLKPFARKALNAPTQAFVSLGIDPGHPRFRAFTRLAPPGCVAMPRALFALLGPRLQRLRSGEMDVDEALLLFEACIDAVADLLPPLAPPDPRIERVTELLRHDHRQPLDALAGSVCLSYYRLSHLFSQEMGMSLRQYVLSLKIQAAARCMGTGMSLTATAHAAGFTDSAHLSKVWLKAFGGPPSLFMDTRRVSIQPAPGRAEALQQAA